MILSRLAMVATVTVSGSVRLMPSSDTAAATGEGASTAATAAASATVGYYGRTATTRGLLMPSLRLMPRSTEVSAALVTTDSVSPAAASAVVVSFPLIASVAASGGHGICVVAAMASGSVRQRLSPRPMLPSATV